jgi:hypothetical protein
MDKPTDEEHWLHDSMLRDVPCSIQKHNLNVPLTGAKRVLFAVHGGDVAGNRVKGFLNWPVIKQLKEQGARLGVVHYGDETFNDPVDFYRPHSAAGEPFDFVFRNYYKAPKHHDGERVFWFPLGTSIGCGTAAMPLF